MNYLSLVGIAAAIIVAVLGGVSWMLRRQEAAHTEVGEARRELEILRIEHNEVSKNLAVARQIASRVDEMQQALDEKFLQVETLKETKAAAEASLVMKNQEAMALGQKLQETEQKLADCMDALHASDSDRGVLKEKLRQMEEARTEMAQQFKLLAQSAIDSNSETLSKQNREQLDALLKPFRDKITEFQTDLQKTAADTARERGVLQEQIRGLKDLSLTMTNETSNLTRALKSNTRVQGHLGEMILESILEKSGLRKGIEYVVQSTMTSDDGQRLRPDVIVNIPSSPSIIIDSKVSLNAFERYINAETDADRVASLSAHVTSLKNHIRGLGAKDYQKLPDTDIDYVVMFMPIEGTLIAALEIEPNLTGYALENNVVITTPTTLTIILRTVANIWQVERRNQNAQDIARRAAGIYDKLVGFIEDMSAIETRLNQAQDSFGKAMKKLKDGRNSLITQTEQLKAMGVTPSKSLPSAFIEQSELDALPHYDESSENAA